MTDRQLQIRKSVLELYNKGLTNQEIANRLGYKKSNAITPYLKELNLKSNCTNNISIKEQLNKNDYNKLIEDIKLYIDKGISKRKTADLFNISINNLKTIIRDEKLKFNNIKDIENGKTSKLSLQDREKIFVEKLHNKDNTKEYHHGFTNTDNSVYIKCLECGLIYKIHAQVIRKKSSFIYCQNCENIKKENRKLKEEKEKQIKEIQLKLQQEANRFLKSKQLTFNICEQCGDIFIGDTKYCSKKCRNKYHQHIKSRKRIVNAKTNGNIDYTITLDKLIKRDNNICYICNRECNLSDYTYNGNTFIAGNYYPSIDHVIPIVKGGTHEWNNIRLAHRICNSIKSDKLLRE